MTLVLLCGGLTFAVGLLILRPFPVTGGRARVPARTQDEARHRELLRQLRDLDDDLAAGKLTHADHVRLRGPVELEAAAELRRQTQGPAGGAGVARFGTRTGPAAAGPSARRHRAVTLLALAGAAAGVIFLLINTVSARTHGQAITGDSVPVASGAAGGAGGSVPASRAGHRSASPQQLAAVAAAEAQVERNPKDVNAHLALAEAYTAAGASQLAAVEYLAVTRIDPANAEANTHLAMLAFEAGNAAQGKAMVDRVLAANPNYPEALYVRGLINLFGLRRRAAAERDLNAYLAVAPFGSHRTAAVMLLGLAQTQGHQ
jgi:cytochrome c-type biogenesis protein CcmH/NrfG